MKNVYLICNAHIDPMWLWEWEEGASTALSTFRSAVSFCEEYGAFVFNHNEVLLYKWIEEYEPELFERIKVQVQAGRWKVIGGWYLQPDCLMPSGEGFVRQIYEGNKYFEEKFGVDFKTAVNFDSFGHTRGLVQIMAKFGYENYLVCRPTKNEVDFPNEFDWIGFDGSKIRTRRHYELYNSPLGKAAEKIRYNIENIDEGDNLMILWGVGNHGGGPSRKDIEDIDKLKEELKDSATIKHSTPDEYFNAIKDKKLTSIDYSLTPCNTGCLTSMALVKQYHRELENTLFMVEKMAAVAAENGLMTYPYEKFKEAIFDLLFVQFHDVLPGTATKEDERAGLRKAEHGLQILNEIRAKSFFALSAGIKAKPNTYPILVYNPHPYPVDTVVECEFQLADQNWADTFTLMDVYDRDGQKLDSQIEKESCNLNLDWRKRVVFNTTLKPMSMNAYDCVPYVVNEPRSFKKITDDYLFDSNGLHVVISKKTGLITEFSVNGIQQISQPIKFTVQEDTEDPWAMQLFQYEELGKTIGEFTLVDSQEAQEFAHIKTPMEPVHLIEDGPVRSSVEAIFKFNKSFLVARYVLDKKRRRIDIFTNIIWCEKDRNLKVEFTPSYAYTLVGETAFGYQNLVDGGLENDMQKWCLIKGEQNLGIVNYGNYAVSSKDGKVRVTLLRSPAYTGHPINDREILHQDRYVSRIDMGERNFHLTIFAGEDENQLSKTAHVENEKPYALSFFPLGKGEAVKPFLTVDNQAIINSALYKEDGKTVIRLFNATDKNQTATIAVEKYAIKKEIAFTKFEIKTFVIEDNKLLETNLKLKGGKVL